MGSVGAGSDRSGNGDREKEGGGAEEVVLMIIRWTWNVTYWLYKNQLQLSSSRTTSHHGSVKSVFRGGIKQLA